MNKLKDWWNQYRGVASDVTRDFHDDYRSGNIGRFTLFGVEAVMVSMFVIGIAILAATITFAGEGWPGVFGNIYARTCIENGNCDLARLQAGMAGAIIIIISLILLVAKVLEGARGLFDAPDNDLFVAVNHIADLLDEVKERVEEIYAAQVMDDEIDAAMIRTAEILADDAEGKPEASADPVVLERLRGVVKQEESEEAPW